MIRVMKTAFRVSDQDRERLFACNRISAEVWNDCLHIAKAYALEHGRWIGRTELQKATKGLYPIHSQSIQAVCHKYLQARDNAAQAKRMGYTQVRYPYRSKRHFPTKWAAQGFVIRGDGRIELSVGLREGKRQKPIVVQVKDIPTGVVKEIEL